MASPFAGFINAEFKQCFNDAIDAVLETVNRPCKIYYPTIEYTTCTNCTGSNLGNRGPNPFINGGNHTGNCPVCSGEKKIPVENSEEIDISIIWDYKKFKSLASAVQAADGEVQTVSNIDIVKKLKNADYIIFNTDIDSGNSHKFRRDGEPTPIGLGADRYILVDWKRQ